MTYTNLWYYVFVLMALIVYYVVPVKHRWIVLLLGSGSFYFMANKTGIIYILWAGVISFSGAMLIERIAGCSKAVLLSSIILIMIPWLFFKHGKFVGKLVNINMEESSTWIVPIGISFFTLSVISYVIDVYKEKVNAETNIFKYLLFVSFFPVIVQGPISRFEQLAPQLYKGHKFQENLFVKGIYLIIYGFFLKFMIADKAGVAVDTIFEDPVSYRGMFVFVGGILYSIQLYTDFFGCMMLAKGVSYCFGIQIADNFDRPYFAVSVRDFWHRWHISLSSWLRDYIYIPLGGSKKGVIKKYRNILITFVVSGIWHGAGYKYLFWGILHGGYQMIEDMIARTKKKGKTNVGVEMSDDQRHFHQLFTFVLIMLAWIVFRAKGLLVALDSIKSIITEFNPWIFFDDALLSVGLDWKEWVVLLSSVFVLFILEYVSAKRDIWNEYMSKPAWLRMGGIACIVYNNDIWNLWIRI